MTVNLQLTFLDKDLLAFSEYLSKNNIDNAILDCTFSFGDFSCECRTIVNDIYYSLMELEMSVKPTNKQVTFYMNADVFSMFQKKYPNVASFFLRRCVVEALRSPEFFQHVFFEVNENIEVSK